MVCSIPLPAKLIPPALPRVLERARLYRRLDEARRRGSLVWIAAPAGMGKTTLLSGYLRARRRPALWYQLDPGDGDPATFFHYLGLSVRGTVGRVPTGLPHFTPEYFPGLASFARKFFAQLVRRLPGRTVLALDNYHEVPEPSAVHDALKAAVTAIPRSLSLIVASREEPPASLQDLAVDVIRTDELRLTEAEAKAIVRLHAKGPLPSGWELHELLGMSGGWAAGLVLLLEHAKGAGSLDPALRGEPLEVVFHYLAREVLERLPLETQEFLLKTAIPPRVTEALARELTGHADARRVFENLHRRRYFLDRRPEVPPVYQYHPLFREFLLERARRALAPGSYRDLCRAAAAHCEKAGAAAEAASLLAEGGDTAALVRLIRAQAPELLGQGRFQTLEAWIRLVPEEAYEEQPWLLYWLGQSRCPMNPIEAETLFARACARFDERGDAEGVWASWIGAVEVIVMSYADLARLDPWLDAYPRLSTRYPVDPGSELMDRIVLAMFPAMIWRRPLDPDCEQWHQAARQVMERVPDVSRVGFLIVGLTVHALQFGDINYAERLVARQSEVLDVQGGSPLLRIFCQTARALLSWVTGDHAACRQAVTTGFALAREQGLEVWTSALQDQVVLSALAQGDVAEAEARLEELRRYALPGMQEAHVHYHAGALARQKGNLLEAKHEYEVGIEKIRRGGALFPEIHGRYGLACVLHELGEHDAARRELDAVRTVAARIPGSLFAVQVALADALWALDRGEPEEATPAFARMLTLWRARTLECMPCVDPRSLARLCAAALEAGIEADTALAAIGKHGLAARAAPSRCLERWPWPVKVYTLGRFEVVLDSRPIRRGRKPQKRPLELLQALLALGAEGAPATALMDALWPEAEADAAHATFAKTLQRLRKLLGGDDVLHYRDGFLALDARRCWTDLWAFEELVSRAEHALQNGNPEAGLKFGAQAVSLYAGPFLPQERQAAWAAPMRERLRGQYLDLLRNLTRQQAQHGRSDQLAAMLDRAARLEPAIASLRHELAPQADAQGKT